MKKNNKTINRRIFLEHSAKITAAGLIMSRLPANSKKLISESFLFEKTSVVIRYCISKKIKKDATKESNIGAYLS